MTDLTSEERWPTMHKLARALREENAPKWIIERALAGFYDDYHPNAHALNMNVLLADVRSAKLSKSLQDRIIGGDFDATKAESDAWADSPEGREAMADFPPELAEKLFGKRP